MKRTELIFTALLVPIDFLALFAAGSAAYFLRVAPFARTLRAVRFDLTYDKFVPIIVFTAVVWMLLFALQGLYDINPNRKLAGEFRAIILGCTLGLAAVALFTFFRAELFNSRFIVLAGWVLATLFVSVGRIFIRLIKRWCYHRGFGTRHTIIIGTGKSADRLHDTLELRPSLGYTVIQRFPIFNETVREEILQLRVTRGVDEILLADTTADRDVTLALMDFADEYQIGFRYSADLYSTFAPHMAVSAIADIPIIEFKKTPLDGWGRIVKRLVDVSAALLLIIILSPLMLLAALTILLESGAPIIYRNERIGEKGGKFRTLKFRSMYQKYCVGDEYANHTEAMQFEKELIMRHNTKTGPIYKIKDDPRITPFGRILRRTSFDEVPQLFNVLAGEMSLVGPRPHQPREVEQYSRHHKRTHAIKPGITGLAQISGRSDLEFEDEVRLDTFYIENWSLLMDLFILAKTPWAVVKERKAL